jgi:predicted NAD-dependent protein-ADP-ribosyltransferase YbiA (DUF1768 family)
VETEYQVAKCKDSKDRVRFLGLAPGKAKRLGKIIPIREDWESIKLGVMESLVAGKFINWKDLGQKLINTHPMELIEGNWWGDRFWGVCEGKGQNHLGKILMRVRERLMVPV